MRNDLTAEQVREKFTYDPADGFLRYRQPTPVQCRMVPAGTVAGGLNTEGYRTVTVNGRSYRSARIVWLYMTGEWPKHKIDHQDCCPSNDKWENLREASDSQQKQNNRKRRDNRTGYKCIVYDRERDQYRWQVVVNGKRIKGKRHATAAEAFADYKAMLPSFHGEFANSGESA